MIDFRVMIDGEDALDYVFGGKSAAITPKLHFEELEACVALGISWDTYQQLPGSPIWLNDETPMSKCDCLAWYRYHKLVPLIVEDKATSRAGRR